MSTRTGSAPDAVDACPVGVAKAAGAEQDRDEAMEFVADHQIVHGAKRNLRIDQGKAGDIAPGRRIAGGDVVDRVERKKQDLAIASRAEADDPVAAGDRRSIAAPVARAS